VYHLDNGTGLYKTKCDEHTLKYQDLTKDNVIINSSTNRYITLQTKIRAIRIRPSYEIYIIFFCKCNSNKQINTVNDSKYIDIQFSFLKQFSFPKDNDINCRCEFHLCFMIRSCHLIFSLIHISFLKT
jgi:tyrosine-protein phosphatase YwqE